MLGPSTPKLVAYSASKWARESTFIVPAATERQAPRAC